MRCLWTQLPAHAFGCSDVFRPLPAALAPEPFVTRRRYPIRVAALCGILAGLLNLLVCRVLVESG